MTRIAYIDAFSGVAGDMLLGALIDAGADERRIRAALESAVEGVGLKVEPVSRNEIRATRVTVQAPEQHVHRRLAELLEIVARIELPPRAAERATEIFTRLAQAEGRIHRIPAEEVELHEVGAVDAVADVCGTALALEDLGIDQLWCSPLPAPRGTIEAEHGTLPLPAPATLELLRGAPLHGVELEVELVTPTGAAIVAALASGFGPLPPINLIATGYGAGARELPGRPNLVRVLVGTAVPAGERRGLVSLIETNLDDMVPELVPDAVESCFEAGALDVWVAPVQMKKGRPGIVLSALARPADERAVAETILRETPALGVRVREARRWELERAIETVEVGGEPVRVKLGLLDGEVVNVSPEHDDCAATAARTGLPIATVFSRARASASLERS